MFRLKELREQRHISQVFLGIELGMSQNTISRYETGKRKPDIFKAAEIAKVLNVTVDELIGKKAG